MRHLETVQFSIFPFPQKYKHRHIYINSFFCFLTPYVQIIPTKKYNAKPGSLQVRTGLSRIFDQRRIHAFPDLFFLKNKKQKRIPCPDDHSIYLFFFFFVLEKVKRINAIFQNLWFFNMESPENNIFFSFSLLYCANPNEAQNRRNNVIEFTHTKISPHCN